jgi:AraC-like DNA-binding protein
VLHRLRDRGSSAQVLSAAATGLTDFLDGNRLCSASLFERAQLDAKKLLTPTTAIGLDQYCEILERASHESTDPNIGLRYGQQFTPEKLGIIGYIALSSSDMLSAARNLAEYFPHHQQSTVTELIFSNPFYHLTYRINSPLIVERKQDAVVTLGMFCNVFRHCAGPDWSPDDVHLEHPPVENASDIAAAFGAPVKFNCSANALLFRPEKAILPMPEANIKLYDLLRSTIMRLGMHEAPQTLIDKIFATIRANVTSNSLSLEFVSDLLGVPSWTMQRRLAEYGINFAALTDRVRQDMAKEYISRCDLQVGQISELLGYSEISAFTRAFNRWFGTSPTHFRRNLV